jgi:HK97 family phage major capsid protein
MKIDLATLRGLDAHKAADKELRDHLTELDTEANGQALTTEARADFEETTKFLVEDLAPVIEELEARAATIAAIAGVGQSTERSSFPVPNVQRSPEDVFDMQAYRRRVESVDDLPMAYIEGAKRALDIASFPTLDKDKAQERITNLMGPGLMQGDPGDVAKRILATGSARYMRAHGKYLARGRDALTTEELRSLQSGSDADGGYALPFTIDPTFILTTDGAANPIRDIGRVVPITTKSWQPVTTAGISASYNTEVAAATDTAPQFADGEIVPLTVKALVKFTAAYAEDFGLASLQGEVGRLIQDAKDALEANKFITGQGTAANPDEPEGIIWKLDDDGTSLVPSNAFDRDALDDVSGDLGERFQTPAVFVGHRKIMQKARALGSAGEPGNSIYDPLARTLLGYPARISSYMDDTTTAGDEPLVIGDFSRYFVIVDRIGLSTEFIPNMFDSSGDPTGERGILARWRNTTKVLSVNAFRLLQLY